MTIRPEIAAAVRILGALPAAPPPTLIFCDRSYTEILANWIEWARTAGGSNLVVFALDGVTQAFANRCGVVSIPLARIGSQHELWIRRAEIFAATAAEGIDFVHSDADAVWLRSPIEEMFALGTDLVFSQGTIWPPDVVDRWGFVVCCGLFCVRASPATAAFFESVVATMATEHDDQSAVNRMLVSDGLIWEVPESGDTRFLQGRSFHVFDRPVRGQCGTLSVSLLPHHRFPRLPEISADTVVAHPLSPKSAEGTAQELRRLGLWRLPPGRR
jgi:Nucleotide-diphospho-sugar transferase